MDDIVPTSLLLMESAVLASLLLFLSQAGKRRRRGYALFNFIFLQQLIYGAAVWAGLQSRITIERSLRFGRADSQFPLSANSGNAFFICSVGGAILGALLVLLDRTLFVKGRRQIMALHSIGYSIPRQLAGVLYGAVAEEVLFRWGIQGVLTALCYKILPTGNGPLLSLCVCLSILVTSLLFGLAHLPRRVRRDSRLYRPVIIRVLTLNLMAGILYGYAYFHYSLAAAMLTHACTDLTILLGAMMLNKGKDR